ncbi:type II toxin-antitoxin system VapC family toxin [Mesorhizobium sp. J428]|uniref:type II toxin-antitoxin system VapC family toxin n=1 Tax=Mesorhizobium sp. J428 TaxID=2898440 RepID=UPI002150923A|nr:type II toxin-antitoxin system VapC family toxin [Mesorhizobium sp. J428]MCR5856812.1 type II toxin-antitoxin system VapC family toxin [Mesorhizobium sp. J428]
MIFIDTSVVIAILTSEGDAAELSEAMEAVQYRATSTLVILEATMRLSTLLSLEPAQVTEIIDAFLSRGMIEIVPIEAADRSFAVNAFAQYGKGRRHPARLNLADCLSYACAKRRGLKLLYKGGDFALTDLA